MNRSLFITVVSQLVFSILQVVPLPVSIRTMHTHDGRRIILLGDIHHDGRIHHDSQRSVDAYYHNWDELIRSLGTRYTWYIEDPFKECVLAQEAWYVPSSMTRDAMTPYMMIRTYGLLPHDVRHNIDIRAFTRRRSAESLEAIDHQHEFIAQHKELGLVKEEIERETLLIEADSAQKNYHERRVVLLNQERVKLEQHCKLLESRLLNFTSLFVAALEEKTLPCLRKAQEELFYVGSSWLDAYMQAIIDRTENMKIRLEKLSYHGENIEELSDDIFRLECVHVDMLALAVAVGEIYRGSSDVVFYMGDAHTVHLASFLESVGLVKTDH